VEDDLQIGEQLGARDPADEQRRRDRPGVRGGDDPEGESADLARTAEQGQAPRSGEEHRDDEHPPEQQHPEPLAERLAPHSSRLRPGHVESREPSWKIGRYIDTTRPPMIVPRTTITSGSIGAGRLATATSTSSSWKSAIFWSIWSIAPVISPAPAIWQTIGGKTPLWSIGSSIVRPWLMLSRIMKPAFSTT